MQYKRNQLKSDEIMSRSIQIFQNIEKMDLYLSAKELLVYVSHKSEVFTHAFIKQCLHTGKHVYVPKVYGKQMQFIQIQRFEDLQEGAFGILEPVQDFPVWKDSTPALEALMLLPALAVDTAFHRLGYGGGYYDRFLSGQQTIKKIAIAFDFQIVDWIETIQTDVKVNGIVTEERILYDMEGL